MLVGYEILLDMIYAMCEWVRADNLTICYHKKHIDVSFSCICPVIDNDFRHDFDRLGESTLK